MPGIGGYSSVGVGMVVVAALLALLPLVMVGFFGEWVAAQAERLPAWVRVVRPAVLCLPYALVSAAAGMFRWGWLAVYAVLPVTVAALMMDGRRVDPEQRGTWREFLVLGALGLAVDLRWLQGAWPAHLSAFGKILLLDAGIYGLLVVRRLEGVGFDLRLRLRDFVVGAREYVFYAPIAVGLGLALGFLHFHARWPEWMQAVEALGFTFLLIAIPEELFFRGWLQNLLERRLGRWPALVVTAVLFGLAHFNKRAVHFNWRYVLLAAIAGVFYGRAWRQERRVGASAITHALVDTTWSLWLR
ncbi:MAG: type II CAAX endopeptidase family protein [Acidobacteriaceae bacterium]